MRLRHLSLTLLASLALAAAPGCSEESSEESGKASAEQAAKNKGEAKGEQPAGRGERPTPGDAASVSGLPEAEIQKVFKREKPKVDIPEGEPPTELVKEDLIDGKGSAAKAGQQIAVNYVGVTFKGGKEFDASFGKPQPFVFPLGQGQVIKGWDQGLEGMKVGGRRQLTIPGDLAYGPQGQPPDIGPDETLVFVIDMIAIVP